MPLMHSENVEDGKLCLSIIEKMHDEAIEQGDEELAATMKYSIGFAKDHLVVIERFGRYPTRNKALGRQSTEEEIEYMKNASSWGQ